MVIMENVTSVPSGSQQAGMQSLMRNDSITGSMPLPGLPSPSGRAVLRRPSIGSFRRASIAQSADRTPSPELTRKSSTGGSFRNVDRGVGLALSRNSSTSSRQSIEPGAGGSLGRRPSMQREMRQTPSRRDSLVMQRVKAFDANGMHVNCSVLITALTCLQQMLLRTFLPSQRILHPSSRLSYLQTTSLDYHLFPWTEDCERA